MANKMLIDSSHPEETRVVVTRGHKVEEFDFESANRRQLRGNIYLAKVTRVEPSLQAAFVEYGGNRHGFLAFSEIHPDYYQIPVADRQALLEADARAEQDAEPEEERGGRGRRRRRGSARRNRSGGETVSAPMDAENGAEESFAAPDEFNGEGETAERQEAHSAEGEPELPIALPHLGEQSEPQAGSESEQAGGDAVAAAEHQSDEHGSAQAEQSSVYAEAAPANEAWTPILPEQPGEPAESGDGETEAAESEEPNGRSVEARQVIAPDEDEEDDEDDDEDEEELEEHEIVEQVGGADAYEEIHERPRSNRRHYKIQEVIKRRQILLVQVVKEERGNKGAALTTYLSLAGRYSVLMPNTGKGGGISRKITSAEDRKRLKELVQELEVPEGMGVILRTAGANRTKQEIKRDYEYLMRLWESVRELTLTSSAPALVYEEGSLIKRAIRDLYNKEIDDILVAGEEGYREAKDFMRMIMPNMGKMVQPYREPQPLFAKFGVEGQLDAMFSNHVTLKSGGYLVINPTEALVSIDVNSGRSTREHNIEDTALRTNLEASEEIARQLRLRDLAGLIVIDFIDMEEKRNDRAVEKKLKDCLKNDRARIQVGRISPFGLLEMSRQRIRTGVLESSSLPCRHCAGTGFVRATPSVALQVLRSAEETLLRGATHNLIVRTRTEVAFYILNQKRAHLSELEERFGVAISILADDTISGTTTFAIDRGEPAIALERKGPATGVKIDTIMPVDEPIEVDPTVELELEAEIEAEEDEDRGPRASEESSEEANGRRRRRRRRRRGGRSGEARDASGAGSESDEFGDEDEGGSDEPLGNGAASQEPGDSGFASPPEAAAAYAPMAEAIEFARPDTKAEDRPGSLDGSRENRASERPSQTESASQAEAPQAQAEREAAPPIPEPEPEPEPVAVVLTPPDPNRPKRGGWWSKAKAAIGGS
jgi:ribonuclease E